MNNKDENTPIPLIGYDEFLNEIKGRIQDAQVRAALAISRELTLLYWQIGRTILERQAQHGWGAKVVERLAADLKAAFPGVEGFSRTNLLYMRAFAEAYPDAAIVQQLLDDSPLPWGHHLRIIDLSRGGCWEFLNVFDALFLDVCSLEVALSAAPSSVPSMSITFCLPAATVPFVRRERS